MGARGPLPDPPALRALKGNAGHRKAAAAGLKLAPRCPPQPRWTAVWPPVGDAEQIARARELAREAGAEWRVVVPELDRQGRLARVDASLLRELCAAVAELAVYSRVIATEGPTLVGQKGEAVRHPLLGTCAALRTALRGMRADLGLSPAARARLPAAPADEPDWLDALLDPLWRPARVVTDDPRSALLE